jgi:triphosphatase
LPVSYRQQEESFEMAKASYIIDSDATLRAAARAVLTAALCKMMENAEGTRAGLQTSEPTEADIEFLHDMRVGSRRLRAALAVFGKIFSKEQFAIWDKAVGRITDALGSVRDYDVQLDGLRKLQATLPANEAYGIGRLIKRQTRLRDRQRLVLLDELARLDKEKFDQKFRAALERAAPEPRPAPAPDAARQVGKAVATHG